MVFKVGQRDIAHGLPVFIDARTVVCRQNLRQTNVGKLRFFLRRLPKSAEDHNRYDQKNE